MPVIVPTTNGGGVYSDKIQLLFDKNANNDVWYVYNKYDVFVAKEINLSLLHAMACGCFPICLRSDTSLRLIRHKENGYILNDDTEEELKNAIVWCESHSKYIKGINKQIASEIFEFYRWEVMAQPFDELYRQYLEDN